MWWYENTRGKVGDLTIKISKDGTEVGEKTIESMREEDKFEEKDSNAELKGDETGKKDNKLEEKERQSDNGGIIPTGNSTTTLDAGDSNGINNGDIAVTDNNEGRVYRNVLENFSTNGENLNNEGVVNENFSDKN